MPLGNKNTNMNMYSGAAKNINIKRKLFPLICTFHNAITKPCYVLIINVFELICSKGMTRANSLIVSLLHYGYNKKVLGFYAIQAMSIFN